MHTPSKCVFLLGTDRRSGSDLRIPFPAQHGARWISDEGGYTICTCQKRKTTKMQFGNIRGKKETKTRDCKLARHWWIRYNKATEYEGPSLMHGKKER